MKKILVQTGIGLASVFAVSLIVSGIQQQYFPSAFWGVMIVAGLYRYITKAKPLNKYVWVFVMTAALFSANLQRQSPIGALIIAGASGLILVTLLAIFDFIGKPLWKRFGPAPKMNEASAPSYIKPLLITAAANGDAGTVHDLITEKIDVNVVDRIGATALMYAARNNQIDCMKVLLEAGADPALKTNKGYTALWFAENNAHVDAANLLRLQGN